MLSNNKFCFMGNFQLQVVKVNAMKSEPACEVMIM